MVGFGDVLSASFDFGGLILDSCFGFWISFKRERLHKCNMPEGSRQGVSSNTVEESCSSRFSMLEPFSPAVRD